MFKILVYLPRREFFGMDVSSSCYWIYFPQHVATLGKWVPYLLGIVMLGMGLTITPNDFKMVFKAPRAVILGTLSTISYYAHISIYNCKVFSFTT